jgi:agmatine deiminase
MAGPDEARELALDLATLLSESGQVTVVANLEDVVDASLRTPRDVTVLPAAHDGRCLRGMAPVFLVDEENALVGGDNGSVAAGAILDHLGLERLRLPAGLDGSGFEVDGEGCALVAATVPQHLGLEVAAAERLLCGWLGLEQVLWLPAESTGRVRFLRPGLVAADGDPDFLAQLVRLLETSGRAIEVVALPMPRRRGWDGANLSYVDCVVAGGVVVLPAFEESRDGEALERMTVALPERRVVSLPALPLVAACCGLGGAVVAQPIRSLL